MKFYTNDIYAFQVIKETEKMVTVRPVETYLGNPIANAFTDSAYWPDQENGRRFKKYDDVIFPFGTTGQAAKLFNQDPHITFMSL